MAGTTRRWGPSGVMVGLWLMAGCAAPPPDAEERLALLEAEEARLDAAFDTVEARLLGNQARLHLWQELERRHSEVSAIQCRVTDAHLSGIARHLQRQAQKAVALERQRSMASVGSTVLTSAQ